MVTSIAGAFDDQIILQGNFPEIADVSSADYVAKTFKGNQTQEIQRPFVVCAKEETTLKVEPWNGVALIWTFPAGVPYPMPLRKIIKDNANTITSIQIFY